MPVHRFDDAGLFARAADSYLAFDPFSPSVIAVYVDGVINGVRPKGTEDAWWTVVYDGRVVGLAMHTPPHHLFLSRMPHGAAVELATSLVGSGRRLPGVNGESEAVGAFAGAWKELTGQTSTVAVSMRMYRLADLSVPAEVTGHARPAGANDVAIVDGWLSAFHDEAQPHAPSEDWTTLARRRIRAGQFRLWEDGREAVSMAAFSDPVGGVARVGPVYTPPARRKRGYGSAVTAEATAAALGVGANDVVLYTDLANPTSNAIYQTIGYRPDHDAEECTFNS